MCIKCNTIKAVINMTNENKTDMIHVRIEHSTKEQAEEILKRLGINTSYAISLFLNQLILNNGFPFDVTIPQIKETEVEKLARIIESTGSNGKVSEKNQKIIHLFAKGDIDYETAVFAIKRNLKN